MELARRGMESMEAFFSLLDECIVADVRAFPLPDYSGLVVGRDKFIEMSRHYWGAWEDYRVEPEEFIDAGQSVVVGIHERGRGKGSGVQLDRRWAYIWTFREGRIVRWEPRRSIEDAVKAAGLPAKPSPRENVEIVRALAEGFQHRQHERAFEFYDPEIEWDASAFAEVNPDIAAVYHGHEGVRAYWRHWLSAWSDLHFEIQDVVDAGDDVVLLPKPAAVGTAQRHPDRRPAVRDGVHVPRGEGRQVARLSRPGIGPRSRGAFGARRCRLER